MIACVENPLASKISISSEISIPISVSDTLGSRNQGVAFAQHQQRSENSSPFRPVTHATGVKTASRPPIPSIIPQSQTERQQGVDFSSPHIPFILRVRTRESQASFERLLANQLYNRVSSCMVGHKPEGMPSGFRTARFSISQESLSLLPIGYITTRTTTFVKDGYSIAHVSIISDRREALSHITLFPDIVQFSLTIFTKEKFDSVLTLFFQIVLPHTSATLFY